MQRRAFGFTLIELAIVIAIIAIIASAILISGGGLFGRAGVASLLSNIKDLAAASREFKSRYGYFPGDLPNAATVINSVPAISSGCASVGAGNGIVDTEDESKCALEHLVRAGTVSKIEYDSATSRYLIGSTVGEKVEVSLWFNNLTNENVIRVRNLPCEVALDIDRKLDSMTPDNKPFAQGSGSVTARDGSNGEIENCTAGVTNDPVPTLLIKY